MKDRSSEEDVLQTLANQGFAICRRFNENELLDVSTTLGVPVAEPRDGVIVKELRAVASDVATPNTLSSRYGTGPFPLHTEAAYWRVPPRFVLLYCVNAGIEEQHTVLQDAEGLSAAPAHVGMQSDPWIVSTGIHPFLSTLLSNVGRERLMLRFDRDCMQPAATSSTTRSVIDSFIACAKPYVHCWQTGDLLIIDNWRMLHGRAAPKRPDNERLLLKVMVQRRG